VDLDLKGKCVFPHKLFKLKKEIKEHFTRNARYALLFLGSYRPFMMFNINTQDHSLYVIKQNKQTKLLSKSNLITWNQGEMTFQ